MYPFIVKVFYSLSKLIPINELIESLLLCEIIIHRCKKGVDVVCVCVCKCI